MTRTETPRTLLCGTLTIATLVLMAGCGTLSTQTVPPVAHSAIQDPKPVEVAPPQTEPPKSQLIVPDQPAVDYWTRRFSGEKHKSFQIQLDRAQNYVVPCQEVFRELGLPEDLVYVALVESGFTPTAQSRAAAVGMFQFISTTGKRFNLEQNRWVDERRHPFKAARAAAEYLSVLYDTFHSWPLALAAYNCGENAVQGALDQSRLQSFWELAQYGYLPSETRDYVPKVLATIRIVRDTRQYGFQYDPQHYTPKHETVPVPGGVKLAWIEKQTGVPESCLQSCNPELCRAATPPGDSTYNLCVPIGTGCTVQAALAGCPLPEERLEEKPLVLKNTGEGKGLTAPASFSHTVRPGDTWFSLARKYQCSVNALASSNGMKPSPQSLKAGQTLRVPATGNIVSATAKKVAMKKQPEQPIAIAAKASRPAQKACIAYPVRPGDTLWSIAGKFHVSVEELCANNKLRPSQKLAVGNVLTICSDGGLPSAGTRKKN